MVLEKVRGKRKIRRSRLPQRYIPSQACQRAESLFIGGSMWPTEAYLCNGKASVAIEDFERDAVDQLASVAS